MDTIYRVFEKEGKDVSEQTSFYHILDTLYMLQFLFSILIIGCIFVIMKVNPSHSRMMQKFFYNSFKDFL